MFSRQEKQNGAAWRKGTLPQCNKPTEAGLNADRGHPDPITVDSVFRIHYQYTSDEGHRQEAFGPEIAEGEMIVLIGHGMLCYNKKANWRV